VKVIGSEEVLLNFLIAGLIDVKGDDDKLVKLQEVSKQLATNLQKNPALALPYTLVALDPDTPPDNSVVTEVLNVLSKNWLTYRNTFQQTPIHVVRAILLEALVRAMPSSDHIALILSICARNLLPHRQLSNEQEIWSSVLFTAELQVDERASKEWTTPSEINIADFDVEGLEPITIKQQAVNIIAKSLTTDVIGTVAKSYTDSIGTHTIEEGNQYTPHSHQGHWAATFGPKMANVIATNINKAVNAASIEDVDLAKPIECIAEALTGYLGTTFSSFTAASAGLERRTNLLWWKEAMYSSSIRTSYRTLDLHSATALMAFDLYNQLPCFSPASVSAFLYEAVLTLNSVDEEQTYPIAELIKSVNDDSKLAPLRSTIAAILPEAGGRGLLVELLAKNLGDAQMVGQSLGISADLKLTMADWSQWLLGDLMVLRAVEQAKLSKSAEVEA
jgi:hypothetical protein